MQSFSDTVKFAIYTTYKPGEQNRVLETANSRDWIRGGRARCARRARRAPEPFGRPRLQSAGKQFCSSGISARYSITGGVVGSRGG